MDYQLLDFGHGRKLERFGTILLDRPSPAAEGVAPNRLEQWSQVDVRWPDQKQLAADAPWTIGFLCPSDGDAGIELRFQLKLTPFGHIGVFPEQAENWKWLVQQVSSMPIPEPRGLNLFAYTGGATLAMAVAGARVVHVDASAPAVAWARVNAALSGLSDRPIRWIVEDAFKFVARELRRGNSYDFIVLDPPGYGHTPNGKSWQLEDRWQELLDGCLGLLAPRARLLWTGHSDWPTVSQINQQIVGDSPEAWTCESGRSRLNALSGKQLDAGYFIRATMH